MRRFVSAVSNLSCALAPNSERLSLKGSACKRRAGFLMRSGMPWPDVQGAVALAATAYENAAEFSRTGTGRANYYPLLAQLDMQVLLEATKSPARKGRRHAADVGADTIARLVDEARSDAQVRHALVPDDFHLLALPQAPLTQLLWGQVLGVPLSAKDQKTAIDGIVLGMRDVFSQNPADRVVDSVVTHFGFMLDVLAYAKPKKPAPPAIIDVLTAILTQVRSRILE